MNDVMFFEEVWLDKDNDLLVIAKMERPAVRLNTIATKKISVLIDNPNGVLDDSNQNVHVYG